MLPFLHRVKSKAIEDNPLWLVVLCDIMTNLMLFFLVLYAFTRQPEQFRKKFVEGLSLPIDAKKTQEEEKVGDLVQKFQETEASRGLPELLRQAGISKVADVELSETQIRVSLSAPVLFQSGEAVLSPKAKTVLGPIAKMLKALPNAVVIQGHTDNVPITAGSYKTNWELSVARAYAVLSFFSKDFGIPEERLIIAGYGEFKPLDSNATQPGRAKNRRIEIIVMRKVLG